MSLDEGAVYYDLAVNMYFADEDLEESALTTNAALVLSVLHCPILNWLRGARAPSALTHQEREVLSPTFYKIQSFKTK